VSQHESDRPATIDDLIARLREWRDTDEPMVEAIGDTLSEFRRCDSQEIARRVLDTVIIVLIAHAHDFR
jgi:hypothetical protein